METTEIAKHDLSIVFDSQARMWKFRSTRAIQGPENVNVDARMTAAGLVVALTAPGIQPGDVDVNLEGNILHIDGRRESMHGLACTVALPRRIAIANVQTTYADGVFDVYLPAKAAPRAEAAQAAKAAKVATKETVTV